METILLVDLNWRSCFNVKIFDTKISREVLVYNFQQLIIHSKLLITLLTNPAISACKERQIKFKKDFVCPFDQTTCHKTKSSTPNELCPGGVQPLTLLSTIFDRQGTPFVYIPLTNGTPYPLHTSLELFIPSRAMAPDSF